MSDYDKEIQGAFDRQVCPTWAHLQDDQTIKDAKSFFKMGWLACLDFHEQKNKNHWRERIKEMIRDNTPKEAKHE